MAPELARFLAKRLPSTTSRPSALSARRTPGSPTSPAGCRRPWRSASSTRRRSAGYKGLATRNDPVESYPDHDVAANLVGFMGTDGPLAGLELAFDQQLAGTDGSETYEVGAGNRIPLGHSTVTPAHNGTDLHTTIDEDLQWYTQRVLRQTVLGRARRLGLRGRDGPPQR